MPWGQEGNWTLLALGLMVTNTRGPGEVTFKLPAWPPCWEPPGLFAEVVWRRKVPFLGYPDPLSGALQEGACYSQPCWWRRCSRRELNLCVPATPSALTGPSCLPAGEAREGAAPRKSLGGKRGFSRTAGSLSRGFVPGHPQGFRHFWPSLAARAHAGGLPPVPRGDWG